MRPVYYIARDWAYRCFGSGQMADPPTRCLRLVEEAAEVSQACGVSAEKLVEVINMVYARPPGSTNQELGGVMMTACLLSMTLNKDPDEVFDTELRRVLGKSTQHFAERNKEKIHLLGKVPVAPHDSYWDAPRPLPGREEDCDDNQEGA